MILLVLSFIGPLPAIGAPTPTSVCGGADAVAATATTMFPSTTTIVTSMNMFDKNNNNNDPSQGIAAVTQSELGQSVRRAVMGGAQVVDQWDLKWERWSDSLRDEAKCDPRTNRRMFDNGFRRDGTRIGNPVLGALCTPEPLHPLNVDTARTVREAARKAALSSILLPSSSSSSSSSSVISKTVAVEEYQTGGGTASSLLDEKITQVQRLVSPSFARALLDDADQPSIARQTFNQDLYTDLRAMGELLILPTNSSPTARNIKETARSFQLAWGEQLLTTLAPTANRNDFTSPFPIPSVDDQATENAPPYDKGLLLDALGQVSAGLRQLQSGGLIGHWEISIPEDDDWNVVTVAVDDDSTMGGQILSKERGQPLDGSEVNAMVRAAMEQTANISYKMDVFFIDPTTTKQELYNPTQLLISLSDLGQ